VLLLTHPEQYVAAAQVVSGHLADPKISAGWPHDIEWPSRVWQGISVMINRLTPKHRDEAGPKTGYDLLLAAGSANDAVLELDDLGAELEY
jgi:hypothetical protein